VNGASEGDGQHIHAGLAWLAESPEGRAWLAQLPRLVDECVEQWSLRIGDPFPSAFESLASAAILPDGTGAVLKVQFPGRENEYEAAALTRWDGVGAVRLLAHDADRHALLLERCEPGTPLSELEQDEALDVIAELLPRLWKPAREPFRSLADEAAWWAGYLSVSWERAGKPFERGLLDAALDVLESFPWVAGGTRVAEPGPSRGQHPAGEAGALASHRPEATCWRTRVQRRGNRPRRRTWARPVGCSASARPADERTGA